MTYLLGSSGKTSGIPWLSLYPITQHYTGPNGETGVDIGTPFHTPISFPVGGKVLGAGYYGGGGVVSIGFSLNGKPAAMYVQHLDTIAAGIGPGASVAAGQEVGLSGGQLSGGAHPSARQFSSGPHTEIGVNAPYGGMWNPYNYGPNQDPLPILEALLAGLPATTSGATKAVAGAVASTTLKATTNDGFTGLAQSLHNAQALYPFDATQPPGVTLAHDAAAVSLRAVVAGLGFLLIAAVMVKAASQAAGQAAQSAQQIVELGATTGVL